MIEPKGPKCKHGEHVCRRCGIDNFKTDSAKHTTVNGVGVVGRALRSGKK